ncbi:uncharacterized protein JCM6883_003003 [Sporobolomyces salmoneus]|uniref:uncharacterized protein n=1 Tax=Sporobolomyces salmoneus TaxID=183962 RepID=UPI003174B1B9
MARKDLGGKREQDEFNLLLSPSRGVADDDPSSLRNPAIQERFRDHIAQKLKKWCSNFPFGSLSTDLKRRNEELGIILLDLRKLREGIHSIRRIDTFACEVYETSVLLSLVASNQAQFLSSLPHLVTVIHPTLARDELATSLASLSVSSTPSRPGPSNETRSFYLTLHLLHSHLLPAFTSSTSSQTTSSPPLSTFLPTLLSLCTLSSLPRPPKLRPSSPTSSQPPAADPYISFLLELHLALIHSSLSTLSTLLSGLPPPPSSIQSHFNSLLSLSSKQASNPLALLLKDSIPQLREQFYRSTIEKAFRIPPDPIEWLSKWLLFDFEVRVERELGLFDRQLGKAELRGRRKEKTVESWDDEEDEEGTKEKALMDEAVKKEAERRAVEFIKLKKRITT